MAKHTRPLAAPNRDCTKTQRFPRTEIEYYRKKKKRKVRKRERKRKGSKKRRIRWAASKRRRVKYLKLETTAAAVYSAERCQTTLGDD